MKIKLGKNSLTIRQISEMCGGLIIENSQSDYKIEYLCTDSREAEENTAFIAIKGDRTDGHNYLNDVIAKGCKSIICNYLPDEIKNSTLKFQALIVDDIYIFLSTLAREYTKGDKDTRIAVTGSVGKTTTKEYISSVVSEKYPIYKTEGNYNSTIGMPLSMLASHREKQISVFEMGMGNRGEISLLSKAVEPNIGIITNIGISHLEALKTRENICLAKLEIADYMKSGRTLILNGDEPLLREYKNDRLKIRYLSLEDNSCDYYCHNICTVNDGTLFDLKIGEVIYKNIKIPSFGRHNVYAAGFAFAVGYILGMSVKEISSGLLKFKNADMREQIITSGTITIIKDCYNACPDSMCAAIDTLCRIAENSNKSSRKIAVLGDMKELGLNSREYHYEIGKSLAGKGIDKLFVFGVDAQKIADGARDAGFPLCDIVRHTNIEDIEPFANNIKSSLQDDDIILIKASRSLRGERIIDYIIN